MSKIVIVVVGGNVTDVYSSDGSDRISVHDYDNLDKEYERGECDLYEQAVGEYTKEIEALVRVW